MKDLNLILVICAAVGMGFGLPFLIFFLMKREGAMHEFDAWRRAANGPRNIQASKDDMDELARRVAALKSERPEDYSTQDEGDKHS